jgi:hypothetical protein
MWTWKQRLSFAFCLSFLTVQVVVPFKLLASPRPARFGWQMWSVGTAFPRFRIVLEDGTTQPPDLSVYVAMSRGEVDLRDALPPHLCRVIPGVVAVEIRTPGSDVPSVYSCR